MWFLAAYVASIVGANLFITLFGLWSVGFGLMAPAGVYWAGLSFGLRDEVQERLGKTWCIGAIVIGAAISALLSPQLALASGTAFLVSEALDMTVYTPLHLRNWPAAVVASNVVGSVVDSVLFLTMAGIPLEFLAGNIVGKWEATLIVLPVLWIARLQRRRQVEVLA